MKKIQKKNNTTSNRSLTSAQMSIYEKGWKESSRFRVAVCGRRFGKTFIAAEEIRRSIRMAVKKRISSENEIWYGAPTQKQAKRVFWPRLKKAIPRCWMASGPSETELSIRIKESDHVVRVVGLDNYDDLRGSGLWFFIGDEWGDVNPSAWSEVIRPMLSTARGHALFIGTPKGYNHFRDMYLRGQPGIENEVGWWSCLYTTLDGGLVPKEELAAARRDMDMRQYRQEYEASFENCSGRCVYAFSRSESIKDVAYDENIDVHIGLDFNVDPMCATIWQEISTPCGDVITCQIDEIIMTSSHTDEMASEIIYRYGRKNINFSGEITTHLNHINIYPDPSGNSRKTSSGGKTDFSILRSRGLKVVALSKAPLIRDRLNVTNALFENSSGERKAFVSPKCRKSIEAYAGYTYKEGSSEPDKNSGFDHIVDASGYYIFTRFGLNRTMPDHIFSMER